MKRRRQPDPMTLFGPSVDVGARHHRRYVDACHKPIGRARAPRPAVISRGVDPGPPLRLVALQHAVDDISLAVRRIVQAVADEHERHASNTESLERVERRLADVARSVGALETPAMPKTNGRARAPP